MPALKKVWWFVFSLWVWLASFVTMAVTAILALLILPVVPFRKSHNWLGAAGMTLCLRYTLNRFRVVRDPDYDPERRSVYTQNHVSVIDGHIACFAIPHAFCGLHNHWHFRIPGYGWIMKLASGIPVYPHSSGRTAEITAAARDRIAKGISILAFPEAHRTRTGTVAPFKRGVFFMARDAGIPIVPMAVHGVYDVNHKGMNTFRHGHTVTIYLGPQIETAGLTDEQVHELAARVQRIVADFADHGRLPADSRAQLPADMASAPTEPIGQGSA